VDQYAAPPVGGLRHQRHEGAGQRRPQPVGAGRLWAEAYSPEVGWAIGDGNEHGEDPAWDASEAEAMYALLENEVVPQFYERNAEGMPVKWLHRIRESMARLTQQFSASRAIREYTENHYLPAATGYKERAENNGAVGTGLLQWKQEMERHWSSLRFGALKVESKDGRTRFQVEVLPAMCLRMRCAWNSTRSRLREASGHRIHDRGEGGGSRGCAALCGRGARNPSRQRLHAARASPSSACASAAGIDAGPLEELIHPSPSVRAPPAARVDSFPPLLLAATMLDARSRLLF